MFERYTERARKVVVLAQDAAREFNHGWIGTEHILLALVKEEGGVARQTLNNIGVAYDDVYARTAAIIPKGQQSIHGHIPYTPRAKKVLELSLREALNLGHTYIGTEHILLGLIREGEGVAARVLNDIGVFELIRTAVTTQLGVVRPPPPTPVPPDPAKPAVEKLDNVSHWTVEYTKPQQYDNGRTYNANGSVEVVASDIHRALSIFCDVYPDATVHVVRKTSRFRTILIDRLGDVHD